MTRKEAILLLLNSKKKANIVEIWAYLVILEAELKDTYAKLGALDASDD